MKPHSRRKSPMRDEEIVTESLPIISSPSALPPLPPPRLKNETAKHGRASHYTISRDETSLGSSGKDRLRAMRKAENRELYQELYRAQSALQDQREAWERLMNDRKGLSVTEEIMRMKDKNRVSRTPLYQSPDDSNPVFNLEEAMKEPMNNADGNSDRRLHAATNALSLQYTTPESQSDTLVLVLEDKIEKLKRENERLLHRRERENKLDVNFEVFHHIPREAGTETYLEKPYWAKTSKGIQLKANSPILYPDAYIQYKSLEFIVERYYSRDRDAPELMEALRQNQIPNPIPSVEHIRPVSNAKETKEEHGTGQRYMIDYPTYQELHPQSVKKWAFKPDSKVEPTFIEQEAPPEPDIYLLPRTILGFNLRRKKWEDLNVDHIREVSWNKDAFNHLVADPETKELVQALVTNKVAAEKGTDLMQNKGNGLIMLLHGGPGTGKTFTAESVAEMAEKPLYPVTCGDIGIKPEDVEKYLESVFYLGRIWGCVVLLDEAELFLEQRSLNDLARNALVSVFLRALEYYDGILILTSNRVGTFDEAFKRAQIWRNFFRRLKSLKEDNIDYDDVENYIGELSEREMNGRQIRNVITTARQWAQFQGKTMTASHLKYAIKVTSKFDAYIKDVKEGHSDDQIARGDGVR
ncbi:hypothetical protein TGAM01_v210303 [Trichoderma gamsii]|uniref:AAA+ ATPase domain-containing protein n=1 Tax=Trichoderma gamsii TaxID=398673 RepID=A0A2P4Z943_9HYPO|nr:hypothetical protein TGAM01_v210303 [Trichoderma gamsii]PON20795.1 hypothetical protein TGAM01_v210303 [Trichoderma gamsii]